MSWEYIVPMFIGGIALALGGMTFLLYLQGKFAQRIRKKSVTPTEAESHLLKRHMPFTLDFKVKPSTFANISKIRGHSPAQILILILLLGTAVMALFDEWSVREEEVLTELSTQHQVSTPVAQQVLPPVATPATPQSVPSLPDEALPTFNQHRWTEQKTPDFPDLKSFLADLKHYQFILVYDRAEEGFQIPKTKISPLLKSLEAWRKWTAHYKLRTEKCDFKTLSKCQKSSDKHIFVILPGNWNFSQLETLMAQNENIILFGMPFQIYDKKRERPVNFKNLVFEKFNKEVQNWLIVKGDQALTLGLNAGTRLNIPPLHTSYRVLSQTPHAVGIPPDGFAPPIRLDIIKDTKSRMVWLDFLPEIKGPSEPIQAGVFRYLLKKKHWSFANWPHKALFTSALFVETQKPKTDIPAIRKALAELNLGDMAVSWIVDAKSVTETIKASTHDSFFCRLSFKTAKDMVDAVRLVDDCKKTLKKHFSQDALGVMTADNPIQPFTYDSIANNQMQMLVTRINAASPMPYVVKSDKDYLVVVPTSYNTLYSLAPNIADRHFRAARNSASFSHVFLTAEQFLANPKTFKDLVEKINSVQAQVLSAAELREWRISREKLLFGESVLAETSSKYMPFSLRVDGSGVLIPQGLNGTPDRLPASVPETPADEK